MADRGSFPNPVSGAMAFTGDSLSPGGMPSLSPSPLAGEGWGEGGYSCSQLRHTRGRRLKKRYLPLARQA